MRNREEGFTALEIMAATAILGGILIYIFQSVDTLTATGRIAEHKVTVSSENFKALESLRDDLRLAYAEPGGENGYEVDPGGEWISYRLLDGETFTVAGVVQPVLSPRIFVFLDEGRLIRAAVQQGLLDAPPEEGDPIVDVKVLAKNVGAVQFGDPLNHDGAFLVRLTTLAGDPTTDHHVSTTNRILITSLNQPPLQIAEVQPAPVIPAPIVAVDLEFQDILDELQFLEDEATDKKLKDDLKKIREKLLKALDKWTKKKKKSDPDLDLSRYGHDSKKSMDEVKHAIKEIEHSVKDDRLSPEQGQVLMDWMTRLGRQAAVNELDLAIARDGKTKELEEGLDRLRRGDVRRGMKDFEKAQGEYKKALEKARKS